MYDNSIIVIALLLILFAQSVFLFGSVKSTSAKMYTIAALVPLLQAALYLTFINQAGEIVTDTYMMNAVKHAEGVALACLLFAHMALWIEKDKWRLHSGVSIIHAVLLTIAGIIMAQTQAFLGLQGMPRGFIDYPKEFAYWQFFISVSGFVFATLIVVGIVRMIIANRKSDPTINV